MKLSPTSRGRKRRAKTPGPPPRGPPTGKEVVERTKPEEIRRKQLIKKRKKGAEKRRTAKRRYRRSPEARKRRTARKRQSRAEKRRKERKAKQKGSPMINNLITRNIQDIAAKQEEGLFERMGIQLGKLSALGQARVASEEAFEQFGQDKEKFMADTSSQTTLKALADTITGYSDTALQDIMLDRTKSTNFFKTIESLKAIAAKGGFGKDSEMIFEKLAAFSDRIQNVAIAQVQAGEKGGVTTLVADNRFGTSQDQLEKVGINQEKIAQLEQEKKEKISELAQAKLDLEDAQTRNTGKFFDTKEVNDLQKKIGDLEKEINIS